MSSMLPASPLQGRLPKFASELPSEPRSVSRYNDLHQNVLYSASIIKPDPTLARAGDPVQHSNTPHTGAHESNVKDRSSGVHKGFLSPGPGLHQGAKLETSSSSALARPGNPPSNQARASSKKLTAENLIIQAILCRTPSVRTYVLED